MADPELVGLALIPILAAASQVIAVRIGAPSIIVLLVVGFLAGMPSWGLDPDELLGDALFPFISLAVAVILFEGGLSLRLTDIRGGVHRPVRRLLSLGVIITWGAAGILAGLLLGMSPALAVLTGAILVVSGPTVVGPLLAFIGLEGRAAAVLRWEGIIVDPIGAIVAVLCLHAISTGESFQSLEGVVGFLASVSWGALVGVLAGALLFFLLAKTPLPRSLQAVVTLATILGAFVVAGALRDDSGYVSAVLMGAMLANQSRVATEHIAEFKETIGVLLTGVLFIVLSARVTPDQLVDVIGPALIIVAALVLVARPLAVLASTVRTSLPWKERAFVAAMAPRGIVAASTASLAAISLADAGLRGLDRLVPAVFVVIVGTVTVYGLVSPVLARALGLDGTPAPEGAESLAGLMEADPAIEPAESTHDEGSRSA